MKDEFNGSYLSAAHVAWLWLALVGLCAGLAGADPLNPLDFTLAGPQTLGAGAYTLDTGDTPSLTGPVNLTGQVTLQGGGLGIAVFSFESLNIEAGAVINVTGPRPVALLARDSLTFAGTINANGGAGGEGAGGTGARGGLGGAGVGGGGNGGMGGAVNLLSPDDGGDGHGPGFGGGLTFGGGGGGFGGGGSPGVSYGNLLLKMEAGSGGGGGGARILDSGGGGGAGGGAVELGALGSAELTGGIINTTGGVGGLAVGDGSGGGAGSGGGVLVHGGVVTRSGNTISATGGFGGGGGGGGGGRVAVQSSNATVDTSGINVAGGVGGAGAAGNGVVTTAQAILTASDLDVGPVRVRESKTAFMGIQNGGDTDTSVNGRFPTATGEFAGGGDVFSGLHPSETMADAFTYAPTDLGEDSQTLDFLSNGGNPQVTISGIGVGPVLASSMPAGDTIDVGAVEPLGSSAAALDLSNDTLSDPFLPEALIGLTLLDFDITGPDAGLFDLAGFQPGQVLDAGELSNLDVVFTGNGILGDRFAALAITTDEDAPFGAFGNSITYSLSGSVVPLPSAGFFIIAFPLIPGRGMSRLMRRESVGRPN